jgi:23S rRNA pseudouridine1911/1915/1917 synthase
MVEEKLNIVYEDNDLMVIEKPAGLVVESEKKSDLTLEKILIDEYKIDLPRGGIVHRLDRNTSGLMVVAKNEKALVSLQNQFASHQVKKIYNALVFGKIEPKTGTINIALQRDPKNRIRFMASKSKDAREAVTKYEVIKYIKYQITNPKSQTNLKSQSSKILKNILSFIKVNLETGRTHQIRAHFYAIGYAVVGDPIYKSRDSEVFSKEIGLSRQFLHASELSFKHPTTGKTVDFKSELPEDLVKILA